MSILQSKEIYGTIYNVILKLSIKLGYSGSDNTMTI